MKPLVIVGIQLIVGGLVALMYQGISFTGRREVVDIGPMEITGRRRHAITLSPIAVLAAVGSGVALVTAGTRRP